MAERERDGQRERTRKRWTEPLRENEKKVKGWRRGWGVVEWRESKPGNIPTWFTLKWDLHAILIINFLSNSLQFK